MHLHKRANQADQKQKPQKINTRYACHDLSVWNKRQKSDLLSQNQNQNQLDKDKKGTELFANKRRHLVSLFTLQLIVFRGSFLKIFLQIQ